MSGLKKHIYEEKNGLHYTLNGDYYLPDLKLPEEHRPIGKYGRMHREYLREVHPARL
ncbi:MAG: TnpV protein, partial [Blautia wexlerae]